LEALLHHSLSPREVQAISSLGLAHIGDAVYEILVRTMLILDGQTTSAHLHRATTTLVCAPAQAEAAERLLPHLTEEEQGYYRRGRNADVRNIPKNASRSQYSKATGLEALFGALYLLGETARIRQLFTILMEDHHAT
jgi:ribonuclease-3 family protein